MNQQQHEMVLEKTHVSGEEEWYCPSCGRRMLINWEPEFKRTILEAGDNYAGHTGGKGGLQMQPLKPMAADPRSSRQESKPVDDDPRLLPWSAWLNKVDFDKRWSDED